MTIQVDPDKIAYDGNTLSVRVGFYVNDRLVSVRVSTEYLTDKFRRSTASTSELIQLARGDIGDIANIVERKITSGVAPEDVIVTTADI